MRYGVLIDGEPGAYGVVFPDLPGCTAMGDTVDNALAGASEALNDWVRGVRAKGGSVPAARSMQQLRGDPEVEEALAEGSVLAVVPLVDESGRAVKANLSLDSGVLAAIDAAARRLRVTRSSLVEILARSGLPRLP